MADLSVDTATLERTGRWFGVGSSTAADGFAAGAEAVAAAVAGRPEPGLVLVFARDHNDMTALTDGVRSQSGPTAKIAGCSTVEPMAAAHGAGEVSVSVIA